MVNKKVLVTGATGFIGANLVYRLLLENYDVHIVCRKNSNKWRLKNALSKSTEHNVDLLDKNGIKRVVDGIRPEFIFHIATYGGFPAQQDRRKIFETNMTGTMNLVDACSNIDYKCFVNTGSSSEYGIKTKPMTEKDITEPINDYGVAKSAASQYCRTVAMRDKKPIVTLRLFSPYGYYEESGRLFPSVILSCLKKETPKLSSKSSVRDFVFIEDVMDAYMSVIKTPGIEGQIFNIGYGRQHSVEEVVNKIVELTGSKVCPEWNGAPKRSNEPKIWQADISKAKLILGWEPRHSLQQGLNKTVRWFQKNMVLYDKLRIDGVKR